jgi:cytochrome c oxidase cbb3-type subunit 1
MTPRLWQRERLYSLRMINWHFWCATAGIVLYASAMWVAGIMQGLMWREYTPQGFLANSFVETVSAKHIENVIRTFGGLMYLSGVFIMIFNLWKTVRMPSVQEQAPAETLAPALQAAE